MPTRRDALLKLVNDLAASHHHNEQCQCRAAQELAPAPASEPAVVPQRATRGRSLDDAARLAGGSDAPKRARIDEDDWRTWGLKTFVRLEALNRAASETWSKESYWIGRGAPGGRGDGTCIIRDDFKGRQTFEGTQFSEGDVAIAVEWYDRHPSDPDGMHFVRWDHVAAGNAADTRYVLNSTELRMTKFSMLELPPLQPALQVVRRTRVSVHRASRAEDRQIWQLPRHLHAEFLSLMW